MKDIAYSSFEDSQFLSAMKMREDLEPFNENKIAAFAIELCFGVDDSISTLCQPLQVQAAMQRWI